MAGIVLEKGKTIYSYGQPMTALHLITNGKVDVSYPGGSYTLGKGDVISICEICSEIHLLGYTTLEDTTILTYPLTSLDSLNDILQKHPDVARLFCLSCFRQINILLNRSSISELNCSELYRTLTDDIATYNTLCSRYRLQARSLEHFDELNAFLGDDSPDIWLNGYYMGLSRILASDNYRILVQESDLSIGMLRKEVWTSAVLTRAWRNSSTICSRSVPSISGNPATIFLIFILLCSINWDRIMKTARRSTTAFTVCFLRPAICPSSIRNCLPPDPRPSRAA